MKKKVWIASPLFFIFPVFLAGTAIYNFSNKLVFALELAAAVISLALILFVNFRINRRISASARAFSELASGENYRAFEAFSLPVAAVGDREDIIWYNDAFLKTVAQKKDCTGDSVSRFLYPKDLKQTITEAGVNVSIGNRQFTVYGSRMSFGSLLYFVDDTYFKRISREYSEKHTCVALISFDNPDDVLTSGISNMEDAKVKSELEALLVNWSQKMGGFIRKLSNNRYILLTDEIHIINAKEGKFDILDQVRAIKTNNMPPTISVGIGRGASTLEESERWARQALDMALGRGGDQVAIKQKGDSYEFFGGRSKGVEKRDKVRTRVIAATLSDIVPGCDAVYIMGHKFSDLDALGASVGMWAAVTRGLNKPAYIVVNKNQSLARSMIHVMEDANEGKVIFISPQEAQQLVTRKSMVVVVDTHSPAMVESEELLDKTNNVIVIDHHRMMVNYIKNTALFFHEPYASSASEMVTELTQYISSRVLTHVEANLLLAGIMLDTKSFVIKTGVRTVEAAAYLRRRGADTVEVKRMFANSFETYVNKAQIIAGASIENHVAIACGNEVVPDMRIIAAQAADELLNIEGVKASFVLYTENGIVNVSARSLGDMNVQLVMEKLGGGGHHSMAGAQISDTSNEEVVRKIREIVKTM